MQEKQRRRNLKQLPSLGHKYLHLKTFGDMVTQSWELCIINNFDGSTGVDNSCYVMKKLQNAQIEYQGYRRNYHCFFERDPVPV